MSNPTIQLDNVAIACADLAAMRRFYGEVVGLDVGDPSADADMFVATLGEVAFFFFSTEGQRADVRNVREFRRDPPGYDHIVFRVANIFVAEERLLSAGVQVEDSGSMPIGPGMVGHYLRFKDPEGNLVGFMQRAEAAGIGS